MASKEGTAGQAFGPVLAAVATMQGNVSRTDKAHAHEFLEKFQKSVRYPRPLTPSPYQFASAQCVLTNKPGIIL